MIVYHGTSYYRYEMIKADGVLKITDLSTATYEIGSSMGTVPGFVYLSDSYIAALYFGILCWSKEISKHHEESPRIVVFKLDVPNDLDEDPDDREFDKEILSGLNAKAYIWDKDIFINESCKGIAYFLFGTAKSAYACVNGLSDGKLDKRKIKWLNLNDNRSFNDYYSLMYDRLYHRGHFVK